MNISGIRTFAKNLLLRIASRNTLVFLFFLILSTAFWLSMALDDTVEREYTIAATLTDVPDNAVVTTDIADTIHVVLRDKGFSMLSYWIGPALSPASFSFHKYASNDTHSGTISSSDIQKAVLKSLHASTKIVSLKPDRLEFNYNYGLKRELPVAIKGHTMPAASYYLAETRIEPSIVTVYADQSELDSMNSVIANVDITNYEDTVVKIVPLSKKRGVKCVPEEVKVTLCPDILTEQTIEVPVTAVGMPEDKVLRTFPSKVVVRFNVGASVFRQVKPEQFSVVADYAEMNNSSSDKCSLRLEKVSQIVRNARLDNTEVDYLIEQR